MSVKKFSVALFALFTMVFIQGVWAQLPCPLYLGDVGDSVAGVRIITGVTEPQQYPDLSLASAGDINGDGVDDFVLSYKEEGDFWSPRGSFAIILGNPNGIGTGGVLKLQKNKGSNRNPNDVGTCVAGIGDVNKNGKNDLIFGSPSIQPTGAGYLVDGNTIDERFKYNKSVSTAWIEAHSGTRLDGINDYDDCGWSVSSAGDFNGDGIPDVIISAPAADPNGLINAGEVYIIYGNTDSANCLGICGVLELDRLDGINGFKFTGYQAHGFFGWSVACAGDINKDGKDDVIIGAPYVDSNGENSGAVCILYGGSTPSSLKYQWIPGEAPFDYFGWSVAGINEESDIEGVKVDVNGDGYSDILIGANLADKGLRENTGKAYLLYGGPNGVETNLRRIDGTNGVIIPGLDAGDQFGFDVAIVKDVNSDGLADLLIGAPMAYPYGGKVLGETYLIYGARRLGIGGFFDIYSLNGINGIRIYGCEDPPSNNACSTSYSGIKVASAGDVNGDGAGDILVGTLSGDVFLIYGVTINLQANPNFIDIDSISQLTDTFTVYNKGTGVLSVDSIVPKYGEDLEPISWFEINPSSFILGNNEQIDVTCSVNWDDPIIKGYTKYNNPIFLRLFIYSNDTRNSNLNAQGQNYYSRGVYATVTKHEPTPQPTRTPQPPKIVVSPAQLTFKRSELDNKTAPLKTVMESPIIKDTKITLLSGEIDTASDKKSEATKTRSAASGRHVLVQFNQTPTKEDIAALEKNGVKILQYIPNNAYWVAVSPEIKTLANVKDCGGIRWASSLSAKQKMASYIEEKLFWDDIIFDNGDVLFQVLAFNDVSDEEFRSAIAALGAPCEIVASEACNIWKVRCKPEDAALVAALDQVEWIEPAPAKNKPCNDNVRRRANVDPVQVTTSTLWIPKLNDIGFAKGVDGKDIRVGVWDAFPVDAHKDFNFTRVFSGDGAKIPPVLQPVEPWWWRILYPTAMWETNFFIVSHATHVAGTIGSNGMRYLQLGKAIAKALMGSEHALTDCDRIYLDLNHDHRIDVADLIMSQNWKLSRTLGIAPACDFYTYDYDNELSEMANAVAANKMDISNHSYETELGWEIQFYEVDDPLVPGHKLLYPYWVYLGNGGEFGRYTTEARAWDKISYDTGLLIVKAAGNDRGDGPDADWDKDPSEWYCVDGPYDCIDPKGVAKNVITVGAVGDNGELQLASNAGPVDDGRIKPDLVANGYTVFSLGVGNCYYESMASTFWQLGGLMGVPGHTMITFDKAGTSNACGAVTGCGALLQQIYKKYIGEKPRPETIKAFLIHGAVEKGKHPGPDYDFGWGEVNVYNSARSLVYDCFVNGKALAGDRTIRFPIEITKGISAFKATLVWTDPPAAPESKIALVNDLDLVLVAPDGTTKHYPWNLNPWDPQAAATKGPNHVDNVEQVYVTNPAKGIWEAQIKSYNIASREREQHFTLVVDPIGDFAPIKPIKLTKSFWISNVGEQKLVVSSIVPDKAYDWLIVQHSGKPVKDLEITSGNNARIDVTVDFAYSPEGDSALLTVNSNAPGDKPTVFIMAKP